MPVVCQPARNLPLPNQPFHAPEHPFCRPCRANVDGPRRYAIAPVTSTHASKKCTGSLLCLQQITGLLRSAGQGQQQVVRVGVLRSTGRHRDRLPKLALEEERVGVRRVER
jgi:hypothetical protein